ncbi:MAG: hypothetical protein AB7T06_19770 [Kofleriaceae bacterium]
MDQVKQQVWIAEGLIDQYGDVLRRYTQAWKRDDDSEQHVLHGEIERIYPAIWEHLDSAAKLSQSSGRTTDAYSQVRARPDLVTSNAIANVESKVVGVTHLPTKTVITSELRIKHNEEGLAIARQASRALKDAWPEIDWTPPSTPNVDLSGGFFSKLIRKLTGG